MHNFGGLSPIQPLLNGNNSNYNQQGQQDSRYKEKV